MQREPKGGERLRMEAFYYQVHPRKAKAFAESEQGIPADELACFIRRYERQEKGIIK
ncbi:hypothetical protein [Hymenobacter crusticola]|uniref:hypothetical protein n=1 Tax=Hymenobacter crusticola TaxID=1770526 RepID=UPI0015C512B9|nr:hypothetical protein [Hymenobacter crusticola]